MNAKLIRKIAVGVLPPVIVASVITYYSFFADSKKDAVHPENHDTTATAEQIEPDTTPDAPVELPQEIQTDTSHNAPATTTPQPEFTAKELLASLAPGKLLDALLSGDCLKRLILALDEISMGYVPATALADFKSATAFTAVEQDGEYFVSQKSVERYSPLINLFCSISPDAVATTYRKIAPAITAKMSELGYKDKTPDALAAAALKVLRGIPQCEYDPPMIKSGNIFQWKDPALEALSPVQKFMLRLGVDNLSRLRAQAEAIAARLSL